MKRESRQNLKAVRKDNGGEYRGKFEEYYRSQAIRLEYTLPKTPKLNGMAERINRTIMERVRLFLAHAKLPILTILKSIIKLQNSYNEV